MSSVNKVVLLGNVGKDPEVRSTQSGGQFCNFSIATSEKWKDKNSGEQRENTQWHNVVVFNDNLVTIIQKYIKKGSKIYVEGQLQTRKWQDQSGADRWSTEVVLKGFDGKVVLLDRKEGGQPYQGSDPGYDQSQSRPAGGARPSTAAPAGRRDDMDDDIPF